MNLENPEQTPRQKGSLPATFTRRPSLLATLPARRISALFRGLFARRLHGGFVVREGRDFPAPASGIQHLGRPSRHGVVRFHKPRSRARRRMGAPERATRATENRLHPSNPARGHHMAMIRRRGSRGIIHEGHPGFAAIRGSRLTSRIGPRNILHRMGAGSRTCAKF